MSYSRVTHHASMVFDTYRNELYASAIAKTVRPDSVVLDLGAGLGVHGLLAAAAGAARVYLVEPQPVVNAARDAARASGLENQLVVVQDRIEDASLPEHVDIIVSVFTGNLLFSEDLLPSLFHARDKYLKPGGTMLPDRAELWLAPLCAPALHTKHVARWAAPIMGLDFSKAQQFAANDILWLRRPEFIGTHRLGAGGVVSDVDLTTSSNADCNGEVRCQVDAAGLCHGLLGWTRIRLADQWLSTDPDAPEVHWSPVILPINPPLALQQGEEVVLTLKRPAHGDWTWSISAAAGSRRHSTFLSSAEGPKELAKMAPNSSPGLSDQGRRAMRVLQLLAEGWSNRAVAEALVESDAMNPALALQEVQAIAKRYGGKT